MSSVSFFESFSRYQTLMLQEFDRMGKEFDFKVIDARRDIDSVQADLRAAIGAVVRTKPALARAGT